ncbi:hypothetical protein GHYDROH2_34010 [Geobacter hydrogenophilus]|uniref:Uncharacterized protein n=1 Tax=Geobacter hydrogenophilus TaxID=40983 RepID=A0A9W6LEC4_9BACT|nr:hypothetical protein GHYDROH2_34010 [Geobacter hydrogenophilus]
MRSSIPPALPEPADSALASSAVSPAEDVHRHRATMKTKEGEAALAASPSFVLSCAVTINTKRSCVGLSQSTKGPPSIPPTL